MIKASSTIAILMATYNGERFLKEQILSVQRQTFTDWTLYVQDDGSKDGTLEVVRSLAADDSRIVLMPPGPGKGAMRNFASLLEKVDAPYYMFADQDDVWLSDKIAKTFQAMKGAEKSASNLPVAVCTDLRVVDSELNEIAPSFWEYSNIRPSLLSDFNSLAGHNLATGCTMMLNAAARAVALPIPKEALMHDTWTVLTVSRAGGKVVAVPEATMLYRQHETNVLGAVRSSGILSKLKTIRKVMNDNKENYAMLRKAGYGNPAKYVYYKLKYLLTSRFQ